VTNSRPGAAAVVQGVDAGAADEKVRAQAAVEEVGPAAAVERCCRGRYRQHIGALAAEDDLDVRSTLSCFAGSRRRLRRRSPIVTKSGAVRGPVVHGIDPVAALQDRRCRCRRQEVVARVRRPDIVAASPTRQVVAVDDPTSVSSPSPP
jgi:hypothetical protein